MAYRPVAKQRLYKQRPLLGTACNIHTRNNIRTVFNVVCAATVTVQGRGKHAPTIVEGLCFLRGPARGVILKTTGATVHLRVQLWSVNPRASLTKASEWGKLKKLPRL
jgi:hypothetical protein